MTTQIDQSKAEAFAGRMIGNLNGAGLTFLTSVAYRTGIFETMAKIKPSTSREIAKAAGLNERYVRECLGGLVVGKVVEYDASTKKYSLPPEHGAFLTKEAGPDNLALFAQLIPLIGTVEDELVECFRKGGGVPYSSYPRFSEVMAETSAPLYDHLLVKKMIPLVPGLRERLEKGIDAADVGTGAGHAINVLAKAFPKSRIVGYDFSEEGIKRGSDEAKAWGLRNARFEAKDVAKLGQKEAFDLVTAFDAIHDQARPRVVLKGIYDALRPGETFLMMDEGASSLLEENADGVIAPLLYTFSTFHCMTVSLAYGGEGLGTCWGKQKAEELMAEAGFKDISVETVEGDIEHYYYVAWKR
ncbi:MAG: class I SAM-dependent methyltransferase [SAR202 cluster bacterium]|nr:class I SAM-dependent methyltransferase [SAR202 cluster bacterium]